MPSHLSLPRLPSIHQSRRRRPSQLTQPRPATLQLLRRKVSDLVLRAVALPQTQGHATTADNESPTPAGAGVVTRLNLGTMDALSGEHASPTRDLFERVTKEIGKLFVGQDELVVGTLVALFSAGHVLIESVPGLGKTLFVRTLGRVLGIPFGRIQFTADLMPSDITGAPIFDMKTQEFKFRPGPVFTQILLADEINRSPAKTHAALLEIMQEFRVTIDGTSHKLDRPFVVLATQNPVESEGTYNLLRSPARSFHVQTRRLVPG